MCLAAENEVSLIFIKKITLSCVVHFWMNIAVQFFITVSTACFLYAKLEKKNLPKVFLRNEYNLHSPAI